jgi:predicted CxxxxCH...CXXCH cytochrome family protein
LQLGNVAGGGTNPNYIAATTLFCYDCHDSESAQLDSADPINKTYLGMDDPEKSDINNFSSIHRPQDIAFGMNYTGSPSFNNGYDGAWTSDGPGGAVSGYFESSPQNTPGSVDRDRYGVRSDVKTNPAVKPGGHYLKSGDLSSSGLRQFDKIPCGICHDPHDTSNQAFIRSTLAGTTITGISASRYMANAPKSGDRIDGGPTGSRKFCITCHGNADTIPAKTYGNLDGSQNPTNIVRTKSGVTEHNDVNTTACTECHKHNNIECGGCHGYPPSPYPAGKVPGAYVLWPEQTHARHLGRQNDNSANSFSPYSFPCKTCHARSLAGSMTPSNHASDNVDIDYDLSALGKANPASPPDAFVGSTYYGPTTCNNVYCHSNGGSDNTAAGAEGYFRMPQWGTTSLRCNGCHGSGTPDNAVQTGMPDYSSGAAGSAAANSHSKHVIGRQIECSTCHFDTAQGDYSAGRSVKASPLRHVDGIRDVVFDTSKVDIGSGTGYDNSQNVKRCDVSCHGTGKLPENRPQWGGTLSCDGCHQSQGAGKGTKSFSPPHAAHADNTTYAIACEQCHARNSSLPQGNTTHVGGDDNTSSARYVEVKFTDNWSLSWTYDNASSMFRTLDIRTQRYGLSGSITPVYVEGGYTTGDNDAVNPAISWTRGTCNNIWCHSNANAASAGGDNVYQSPTWANTTSPKCTICHLGPDAYNTMSSTTGRMSRGHWKHLATNRYGFSCDECHANTAAADCTTLLNGATGYTYHLNGTKNVDGQDVKGGPGIRLTAINDDGMSYDSNQKTCSNTYCHSMGSDNNATGGFDNSVVSPAWDNATGTTCTSCHGGGKDSGKPITTKSHGTHVAVDGIKCSACHADTVNPGTDNEISPKGYSTTHINGVAEVVPGPDYPFVVGSCTNISCHAPAGSPDNATPTLYWGNTIGSCFDCHGGTEPWSYKPQNDYDNNIGRANPVNSAQYSSTGHGRTTAYPSGNPAANFNAANDNSSGCYYCHSPGALHGIKDPADPFRLGSGFATNTDALCLKCHGASVTDQHAASQANRNMNTHAQGITGTKYASWPVTPWKCVDCHDPHGDSNYLMIRSAVNASTSSSDSSAGSNSFGSPRRTVLTPVSFTSRAGQADNSYATLSIKGQGICEICHTQNSLFYNRAGAGNAGTHSGRTSTCTGCHKHDAGFAPTACKGCHGVESLAATAPDISKYWADNTGQGGHGRSGINIECEACHDVGYLSSGDHKTDNTAGAGPPPANINTLLDPDVTSPGSNRAPTRNTAHLKSGYFPTSSPSYKYQFALAFNAKCGNPVTGCHNTGTSATHNNHPVVPTGSTDPQDNVMRFGEHNSVSDPKLYYWYPAYTSYSDKFWETRSPWTINDLTTDAIGSYSDNNVKYGVCVTCHDPHGTDAPKNLTGTTNRMLRGNSKASNQFCNKACHTSKPPP